MEFSFVSVCSLLADLENKALLGGLTSLLSIIVERFFKGSLGLAGKADGEK